MSNQKIQSALGAIFQDSEVQAMAQSLGVDLEPPTRANGWRYEQPKAADLSAVGAVGTYISGGDVRVEQNKKLRPRYARGNNSKPGLLNEVYHADTTIFKSQNEIQSVVESVEFTPELKDAAPEIRELVAEFDRRLKRLQGGPSGIGDGYAHFVKGACSAIRLGFCCFETVWRADGFLESLLFREQSTVQEWLVDETGNYLIGAKFQPEGSDPFELYIEDKPGKGGLLHMAVHSTGLNFEGLSPVRVAYGLRKIKELVLKAQAVGYQKYGVPLMVIKRNLSNASATDMGPIGGAPSQGEISNLLRTINNARAGVGTTLDVPEGLAVDYIAPTNQMPTAEAFLAYLDSQIAMAYSNEGALYGSGGYGSYAMASISDSKFLRSAPYYAQLIALMLTDLLWRCLRGHLGDGFDALATLPRYRYRFVGTQDAGKWIADVIALQQAGVQSWTPQLIEHAAILLGVEPEALQGEPVAPSDGPSVELEPGDRAPVGEGVTYNEELSDKPTASDSFTPTKTMRENAKRGLEYRAKAVEEGRSKPGGTEKGIQRASNIVNGNVSYDTVKKMYSFLSRNQEDSKIEEGKAPWDDRGYVAKLLWGGDEGLPWARAIIKRVEGDQS